MITNIGKINPKGKEVILEIKENGCIECISHCKDNCGYTRIKIKGKHERLFRYIYEQKYGIIPKGMLIRHKCDNPSCINLAHLEIGTPQDNVNDMIKRGRDAYHKPNLSCRGENNIHTNLKEFQVKEIYLSKLSSRKIAKIYNVDKNTILNIRNKKTWKWFTDTLD